MQVLLGFVALCNTQACSISTRYKLRESSSEAHCGCWTCDKRVLSKLHTKQQAKSMPLGVLKGASAYRGSPGSLLEEQQSAEK